MKSNKLVVTRDDKVVKRGTFPTGTEALDAAREMAEEGDLIDVTVELARALHTTRFRAIWEPARERMAFRKVTDFWTRS
jgi:hypothetical protein